MLTELHIKNFAIIEALDLQFSSSLITFTGETGAGKSILIDAVETLLGGRLDATFVRSGAEQALVEGVFCIDPQEHSAIHTLLETEALLDDAHILTLGREIRPNGRSVARVNGRSVSAGLLREIGSQLVDIHGQSEHLSLLHPAQHLGLLDRYARLEATLSAYTHIYRRLQTLRAELNELRQAERDAARHLDMLNYQINEIESAHLHEEEEERLRQERNRLSNAETLATLVQSALTALDDGTPEAPAVTDLFGQVADALQDLGRLDPTQAATVEQAQATLDSLAEMARQLRDYQENIEFNPRRLDQVEERLNMINMIKRKYGESITAVLAFGVHSRQERETITHAGEHIAELAEQEAGLLTRLSLEGQKLSQQRRSRSDDLARALEAELASLQMSQTRFQVAFEQQPDPQGVQLDDGQHVAFDANGLEKAEFLIAPNPGEGLKPLARIASGGETSRLMLALKNVLAGADHIPTLIFDEIDQGIGGRMGGVVGQKLWLLAQQHQVMCVTHLPQLAAYGEQHFHVHKLAKGDRTITQVEELKGERRIQELAVMLGEVSQGTLQSAGEILQGVHQFTRDHA